MAAHRRHYRGWLACSLRCARHFGCTAGTRTRAGLRGPLHCMAMFDGTCAIQHTVQDTYVGTYVRTYTTSGRANPNPNRLGGPLCLSLRVCLPAGVARDRERTKCHPPHRLAARPALYAVCTCTWYWYQEPLELELEAAVVVVRPISKSKSNIYIEKI